MEEDRVQDATGGGIEAERDIGDTEHGADARKLALDLPDGIQGGHAVFAQVVVAGGERKGEGVEDQVLGSQPVAVDRQVVDAMRDPQLPLQGAGLALLVDEEADDTGPMLLGQLEHPVEPGAGRLTVFEVGAVEQTATTQPLQPRFHHLGLGRVEDHRSCHVGGEGGGQPGHVGHPVPAHVVDTEVHQMGALLDLLLADGHTPFEIVGEERLLEGA